MKSLTILLVVFCLGTILSAQQLTRLETKAEYVQAFSAEGSSVNYIDALTQVGKVALSADVYGFHHGYIGATSITVPFVWKGVTLSPGAILVFGVHETGPGFVTRWETCKKIFCTEGTAGFFHPLKDGRRLQFIGDPVDLDIMPFTRLQKNWLKTMRVGYSAEFGRYGKHGLEADRIHSGQSKILIGRGKEIILSYVPSYKIARIGFVWRISSKSEHH
jgi:hypothetical protein